jgi:hypothetical protein
VSQRQAWRGQRGAMAGIRMMNKDKLGTATASRSDVDRGTCEHGRDGENSGTGQTQRWGDMASNTELNEVHPVTYCWGRNLVI